MAKIILNMRSPFLKTPSWPYFLWLRGLFKMFHAHATLVVINLECHLSWLRGVTRVLFPIWLLLQGNFSLILPVPAPSKPALFCYSTYAILFPWNILSFPVCLTTATCPSSSTSAFFFRKVSQYPQESPPPSWIYHFYNVFHQVAGVCCTFAY